VFTQVCEVGTLRKYLCQCACSFTTM